MLVSGEVDELTLAPVPGAVLYGIVDPSGHMTAGFFKTEADADRYLATLLRGRNVVKGYTPSEVLALPSYLMVFVWDGHLARWTPIHASAHKYVEEINDHVS